jgi:phage-related protein
MALVVSITGDTKGLDAAVGSAGGTINAFGKSVDLGGIAKVTAFAGVAGIAVTAITAMTMAAAADRDEQVKLAATIANATGSTEDYTAATDAAIKAGQAKAFTDSETREALGTLITATKDMDAAQSRLTLVQDIAREANVSLATAADAVAKAHNGNATSLSKMLPGLTSSTDATEVLAAAQTQAAGAADTFAASSEGQMMRTSDSIGELTETIGSAFLPILDALLPALLPIIEALGEMITAVLPILTPMIKAAGLAIQLFGEYIKFAAGLVADLLGAIQDMIKPIQDLLDELAKLTQFELPDIVGGITDALPGGILPFSAGTPEGPSGATTRSPGSQAASGGGGGVTINIVGDPATVERTVVRALRTYTRRNGAFVGELGGIA